MENTTKAPARIWITPAYMEWDIKTGEWVTEKIDGAVEYVRADLSNAEGGAE